MENRKIWKDFGPKFSRWSHAKQYNRTATLESSRSSYIPRMFSLSRIGLCRCIKTPQ